MVVRKVDNHIRYINFVPHATKTKGDTTFINIEIIVNCEFSFVGNTRLAQIVVRTLFQSVNFFLYFFFFLLSTIPFHFFYDVFDLF